MTRATTATAALLLLLALSAGVTACATGGTMPEQTPSRTPFETTTPGPIPTPVASGVPTDVPDARWDAIVADLADRGVTGTPELVSAVAVTWSNGSRGCPQPGMSYTTALEEGMQVLVAVDGTTYDYRFGRGDTPLLCEA